MKSLSEQRKERVQDRFNKQLISERRKSASKYKRVKERLWQSDKMIQVMRQRLASEKSKRMAVLNAVNRLIELNMISDAGHAILIDELHKA